MDSIYASLENGEERAENLRYFCQLAGNYEANGISDLSRFLDQLATVAEHGLTVQVEERTENAVRITIEKVFLFRNMWMILEFHISRSLRRHVGNIL